MGQGFHTHPANDRQFVSVTRQVTDVGSPTDPARFDQAAVGTLQQFIARLNLRRSQVPIGKPSRISRSSDRRMSHPLGNSRRCNTGPGRPGGGVVPGPEGSSWARGSGQQPHL